MKEVIYVPNYYKDFKCIADKCRHTCCAGWEIDIDDESLERFLHMEGALGDKMRREIEIPKKETVSSGEPGGDSELEETTGKQAIAGVETTAEATIAHFKLREGDRCPFLREDNLCELILECGEESLCQICTDHPRFRNFWTGRIEVGLGLACEAAAELILGQASPLQLTLLKTVSAGEGAATSCTAAPAATAVTASASEGAAPREVTSRLEDTLPPDEQYLMAVREDLLREAGNLPDPMQARLAEYLIFRHIANALYDDMLDERIAFVQYCFDEIVGRWESADDRSFESLCDIARQFSVDVEYNEDFIAEKLKEF